MTEIVIKTIILIIYIYQLRSNQTSIIEISKDIHYYTCKILVKINKIGRFVFVRNKQKI